MDVQRDLTPRQRQVYRFIRDKIRNRGYGPTVREIGQQFQIKSPNGVVCHLKALERKGLIHREEKMSRAICLSAEPIHPNGLPLAGRISAGGLLEAIAQDEQISFDGLFGKESDELFVLQVEGESMIDDQIADGDYVVVHKQETAERGQIVIAMTDENEATLKRWFPESRRIRLQPSNAALKPIYVKNAQVLGVVVGVVRKV